MEKRNLSALIRDLTPVQYNSCFVFVSFQVLMDTNCILLYYFLVEKKINISHRVRKFGYCQLNTVNLNLINRQNWPFKNVQIFLDFCEIFFFQSLAWVLKSGIFQGISCWILYSYGLSSLCTYFLILEKSELDLANLLFLSLTVKEMFSKY